MSPIICKLENIWMHTVGNIFKRDILFVLNDEKTTVTLTINGMIDEFDIKMDEEKLKVFEPELKYRFRGVYPHSNIYNKSIKLQSIVSFILILTLFFIYCGI